MQQEFENYMQQCLALAETALLADDPPVGALIVFEGHIIGTGIEAGKSTGDITNIIYGVSVPFVGGATSSFGILNTEDVPKWGVKPRITAGICEEACNVLNKRFAGLNTATS